jgi:hypothetical protein
VSSCTLEAAQTQSQSNDNSSSQQVLQRHSLYIMLRGWHSSVFLICSIALLPPLAVIPPEFPRQLNCMI